MSVFSIVTIRRGSKGLKNKCIRKINNKSIFEYTIEYSLELNNMLKEEVFTVVSSDSGTVKKYCSENNICFLERTKELSSDSARIEDVIYDAYCKINKKFDYISLLYGNIPIRYPSEFLKAYTFLRKNKDYDSVISMQNVEKFNPAWMFALDENLLPHKKSKGHRRQNLDQFMVPDGHTILFDTKHFLDFMKKSRQKGIIYEAFGEKIKPMINNKLIVDIDTEKDFIIAESVIKFRKYREGGK